MSERQQENLGAGMGSIFFTFIGIIWGVNKFLLLLPIIAYFIAVNHILAKYGNK